MEWNINERILSNWIGKNNNRMVYTKEQESNKQAIFYLKYYESKQQ